MPLTDTFPAATADIGFDQEAVLRGDHAAFEALVHQESPRLFRVIQRIVRDEEESRSILQETFLQAYRRRETFRGEAKLTTWLYGIGINLARMSLRKRRRMEPLEEQEIDRLQPSFFDGAFAAPPHEWSPERLAVQSDHQRIVREAIERLPESYRLVIMLRDIEELSTEEAAEILKVTPGALRVRLHRARQALRALLDPYFGKTL